MIREKAGELLNLLKQGKGVNTLFNNSYFDEETTQIIEVITNECKSTIMKDGKEKRYESDIPIHFIREIIQQLLSNKDMLKNSLVSRLTTISQRNIPGIMTPVKINKKMSQDGRPYIEIEKPFPDSILEIIGDEKTENKLINDIIKPYVASICKHDKTLSKRHLLSRLFNFKNKKELTKVQLYEKCLEFIKSNTNLDEEKIQNTAKYLVYHILDNEDIKQTLIRDEISGNSLEVLGQKKQRGYYGMLQNMSNNMLDILRELPNPNDGLKEIEDIYANIVGELQALSIEPAKDSKEIEEQIKDINKNLNRNRQAYYSKEGYRTVNVGAGGKDVGYLKKEYIHQAMQLYSKEVRNLIESSKQMGKEEYIKEVAKLHFRFVHIHPFPDGNGRTARAISNMLLLEKNEVAIFDKQNKQEYISYLSTIPNQDYTCALYTNQQKCSRMEETMTYKLEEYIGIKCLGKEKLYNDRDITEELPYLKQEEQR